MVQFPFCEATRVLFVHKENQNNYCIQQFFSTSYCLLPFWRVPQSMHAISCEKVNWRVHCSTLQNGRRQSGRRSVKNILFLFSLRTKKYYRSFAKLKLSHWCHMDCFTDVLSTFRVWEHFSCLAVCRELSNFINNILILFEDERRSYRYGTTWGWVINDRIIILGWTSPLIQCKHGYLLSCVPFKKCWVEPYRKWSVNASLAKTERAADCCLDEPTY